MRLSGLNLGSKIPSDTFWRVQLVSVKVQAHSSSEPEPTWTLETCKSTNLLSRWCSSWMPAWLRPTGGTSPNLCSIFTLLEKF